MSKIYAIKAFNGDYLYFTSGKAYTKKLADRVNWFRPKEDQISLEELTVPVTRQDMCDLMNKLFKCRGIL